MIQMIEKLNRELLETRERAAVSHFTVWRFVLCACEVAAKQEELAEVIARETEVQHGE